MRPGPIGPGNGKHEDALRQLPSGFNEARPNWAGKSAGRADRGGAPTASMRPGPIGPGNGAAAIQAAEAGAASMRPGPIGPGNHWTGGPTRPDGNASMRPGPIGPGNRPPPKYSVFKELAPPPRAPLPKTCGSATVRSYGCPQPLARIVHQVLRAVKENSSPPRRSHSSAGHEDRVVVEFALYRLAEQTRLDRE